MEICGKCLHDKDSHTKHNGHFMYCANCFGLCLLEEYNEKLSRGIKRNV